MAARYPHSIQRVAIELQTSDQDGAFALQQEASHWFWQQVQPALLKMMDKVVSPHELIRFDQLTIDLGTIQAHQLGEDLSTKLANKLLSAIEEQLDRAGHSSEVEDPRQNLEQYRFKHWLYFLEKGYFPFTALRDQDEAANWQNILEHVNQSTVAANQLKDLLEKSAPARERLLHTYLPQQQSALLTALTGHSHKQLPAAWIAVSKWLSKSDTPQRKLLGKRLQNTVDSQEWTTLIWRFSWEHSLQYQHQWETIIAAFLVSAWQQSSSTEATQSTTIKALVWPKVLLPVRKVWITHSSLPEAAAPAKDDLKPTVKQSPKPEKKASPPTDKQRSAKEGSKQSPKAEDTQSSTDDSTTESSDQSALEKASSPFPKKAATKENSKQSPKNKETPSSAGADDSTTETSDQPTAEKANLSSSEMASAEEITSQASPSHKEKDQARPTASSDTQPLPTDSPTEESTDTKPEYQPLDSAPPSAASADLLDDLLSATPNKHVDFSTPSGEYFYVLAAGVVIVHPFLSTLFTALGWWKEDHFTSDEAQQRAVYLLHYLATGELAAAEADLLLAKLLCGRPFELPLQAISLTDTEIEEADQLLAAVIKHWGAIGQASPEGIREGFFQREAKIEKKETAWQLTIERKAQDILLGKLPWGLSIIKLPWLKELVKVTW